MKKVFRILLAVCLAVMLTFACTACGSKDGDNSDANDNDNNNTPTTVTITFSESSIDMTNGKTRDISVAVTGSDEAVTFTTSNSRVVDVTSTGKTTATLEAKKDGEATIKAAIGDVNATLDVTVITRGIKVEGNKVLSVAPGDTHEFDVTLQNISGTITVESDLTGVTAQVKEGSATAEGATIEFTGAANVEIGKTAILTVKAGDADPAEVEVDTYSKGILFGDGHYQAEYCELDAYGVSARGVGRDFVNGALVIPRYVYYTPDQNIDKYFDEDAELDYGDATESFWAPVTYLGVRTGDNQQNQGSMPPEVWKFDKATPFFIEENKTITSLDTGDSVRAINEKAFQKVGSITKVHIGKAMIHICEHAFDNEEAGFTPNESYTQYSYNGTIDELTFDKDCKITNVSDWAFSANKLTKLILPDSLNVIGPGAFWRCGTKILKYPKYWNTVTNQQPFFDLYYLEEIYIPWQNCFSLDDNGLLFVGAEGVEDLKVQLNATDYGYSEKRNQYSNDLQAYNLNFSTISGLCINGTKDALQASKVTVHYLGNGTLMNNVISVRNKKIDDPNDDDGQLRATNETGSWEPVIGDNFLGSFCSQSGGHWVLGNDKVDWVLDSTCPYAIDGTTIA